MHKPDENPKTQRMSRRALFRSLLLAAIAAPVSLAWASRSTFASTDLGREPSSEPDSEPNGEAELFPIAYDDVRKVSRRFQRKEVDYRSAEAPGTIVVDVDAKVLYFTLPGGRAIRYGIGVGKQGFEWSGSAIIRRKAKWPRWTPPKEMVARDHLAAQWADGMPGGPTNPLGARALYLYQGEVDTLYRIHGTYQPQSIGKAVSSGCIRLLNADVVDLFERVPLGTRVVVKPSLRTAAVKEQEPEKRFRFFRRGRDR